MMTSNPLTAAVADNNVVDNSVDVEMDNSGDQSASTAGPSFPLARVKKIMKADKDVHLVSAEAVQLTSIAAVICYFY